MKGQISIAQFMVTDVRTLSPEIEIGFAAGFLMDEGIAGAPVVNGSGELVGILTKKDCFKAALNAAYYGQWGGNVERYMTRNPETLDAATDIVSAAERFIARPYRMFPVLDEEMMVGILTRSDLLRSFLV
ncbi:CBS domain-containing protein [Pelagibacterium flavum]|uniref:CBS domain-containing protein n=1 Tax=Pelagibacterium flavum TaxID=2984530 RepID=A0ABY6IVT9_9HYPH|nr:CBS domain-containing protein [Pelagibacterium sp. YIM 151497]UYQ73512.1 CBS domain-containing protein [Pelagibacterium sp. YIM 151497]